MIIYPDSYGLLLSPHSETFRNIKVLKTSTYTIATAVSPCEDCTFLQIKVGDTIKKFYLNNNETVDKWLYFTTNLTAGNNDLRIYSDGYANLNKMIIYSDSYQNESLSDLFKPKEGSAELLDYKKIDSTHYQVKVNAPKPFILKFTGPYNPSWVAYANGKKYSSMDCILM